MIGVDLSQLLSKPPGLFELACRGTHVLLDVIDQVFDRVFNRLLCICQFLAEIRIESVTLLLLRLLQHLSCRCQVSSSDKLFGLRDQLLTIEQRLWIWFTADRRLLSWRIVCLVSLLLLIRFLRGFRRRDIRKHDGDAAGVFPPDENQIFGITNRLAILILIVAIDRQCLALFIFLLSVLRNPSKRRGIVIQRDYC